MNKTLTTALIAGMALALAAGCEDKKPADAVKGAATKAADATKGAATKAADATKDAATKAADATKDAATKAADATKGAMDKAMETMKADATKWITDTVEKQWPEAKKSLDAIGPKIAELKDAGVKTKAEGMLKDLTGQVGGIEDLVGKIKGFSGGKSEDFSKMVTDAKGKFDGFMKGLSELKGLVGMK